jgi:nitrite reductase (NADH) large subunit
MEKAFLGVATPHKVKMGVSGCPRNCAEATVKDIGLVGVQGGWQVHTGGAAGMVVRKADLLVTVETREEALDAATRYLQHYREEAEVGERTHAFNERVGIDAIRAAISDGDVGPTLIARFRETKARVSDPWLERETPVHPRQFGMLAARRAARGTDG